jgi:Mg2+-importing ATPase
VDAIREHRAARLLAAQFTSPIILILAAATVLSIGLGDVTDAEHHPGDHRGQRPLGVIAGPRPRCAVDALLARGSSRRGDAAR